MGAGARPPWSPPCGRHHAPLALEGAINGQSFLACVRWLLAPSLRPGDVAVLGNLGGHKVAGVREAVEATLCHLPPYSPGPNPVEKDAAEPEASVRDAVARTTEALEATSAAPLPEPCPQDAPNRLAHRGLGRSW